MATSPLTPRHRRLTLPGSGKPTLRRPDLRWLSNPRPSGAPLDDGEIDDDDLLIHRSHRVYAEDGLEVRYFLLELSQKIAGSDDYHYFWKAVRMVRLTRVPRYLRQAQSGGPDLVFKQQRDMMAALREQRVLFLNMIAKSAELPLIFAYGVQAVGDTPEEAMQKADESYAVLTYQLDGTYQQLEYKPIDVKEGELLARYQNEWDQIAMARGRPLPTGGNLSGAAALSNRTDVESTQNQLESFIRGMGDKSFMLTLITVPLAPAEISLAWRNLTKKLSDVRSDQEGTRGVQAGIALPLGFGTSLGDSQGNTHSVGQTDAMGASESVSESTSDSVSYAETVGTSESVSEGVTESVSQSQTQGASVSQTESVQQSTAAGESVTAAQSQSDTVGVSQAQSDTVGTSETVGATESQSVSQTESLAEGRSVTEGSSLSASSSEGVNWSNSIGQSVGSSLSATEGQSSSVGETVGSGINVGVSEGETTQQGVTRSEGSDARGGLFGFLSGGMSEGEGSSLSSGESVSRDFGQSLNTSETLTEQLSRSQTQGVTETANRGESVGGTATQSATEGRSASVGEQITATTAAAASQGQSLSQTQGISQSASQTQAASQSQTAGQSLSQGQSLSESVGRGQSSGATQSVAATQGSSQSASQSVSQSQSASQTDTAGRTVTEGASQSASQQRALADAWMVAHSRQASQTGSLGVVPNFGVQISRRTFDESKRIVGDILEAQMKRYVEGVESGGFLYQMFLVCPDRDTLAGGSGLLKSAFWGTGNENRLPQPFHTIDTFEPDEREKLLSHAAAYTSYRRREPVTELIEPFLYSSYVTPGELAAFNHPPTTEASGLLSVHDSMPVLAMPADREDRDVYLGRVVNGERAKISSHRYGIDVGELTHTLVAGATGSGKTTTLMRLLTETAQVQRTVVTRPSVSSPEVRSQEVPASILGLDWMQNMRDLASVVEPERFQFFSLANPELGAFRFNLLEIPGEAMSPTEWLQAQADNFTAAWNLGEFGRSLVAELMQELYEANRLEPYTLRPAVYDQTTGATLREATVLEPIDPADLPDDAVQVGADGSRVANVFTCPRLSRLVSIEHLAVLVAARVEQAASVEGARLQGTAMRDRIQSLWRRIQYFAPGGSFSDMLGHDPSLTDRQNIGVSDLIDPSRGLVTIIEADGLDMANRRLILGSVMLAVYRWGMNQGEGFFDFDGKGPGTFVVLEEAHELFGEQREDDDAFSAQTRTALYESMFRRARALGMRLIAVAQNAGAIPPAVTSNTSTVFVHRTYDENDRKRIFSLLNWNNALTQQQREWRYLGEMARGYVICRLDAKDHYLQSAPVQIKADPPGLGRVGNDQLAEIARANGRN